MSRSKAILMLLVAMMFGLFAMVAAAKQMSLAAGSSQQSTPIIVASKNIHFGSILKEDDLKLIEWPGKVPFKKDSYFKEIEALVGKVVKSDFVEGEPIFKGQISFEDSKIGLAALIPPGMRAQTVKVDKEIEAASLIVRGSRVDVVVTLEPEGRSMEKVSRTILRDIEVLFVGAPQTGEEGEDAAQPQAQTYSRTSTVTLLVTPRESEILHLATTEGQINLVVRGFGDDKTPEDGAHRVTTISQALGIVPKPVETPVVKPVKPKGPTPEEFFNAARVFEVEGKDEEAIKRFTEIRDKFPQSEYAVKALEQISKIEAKRRRTERRAAFAKRLAELDQAERDGNFVKVAKDAELLIAEYSDLDMGGGASPQESVKAIQARAARDEDQAKRFYQRFRNFLLLKALPKAKEQLAAIEQRYPKSRYTVEGHKALEAAAKGLPIPPAPKGALVGIKAASSTKTSVKETQPKPTGEEDKGPVLVKPAD